MNSDQSIIFFSISKKMKTVHTSKHEHVQPHLCMWNLPMETYSDFVYKYQILCLPPIVISSNTISTRVAEPLCRISVLNRLGWSMWNWSSSRNLPQLFRGSRTRSMTTCSQTWNPIAPTRRCCRRLPAVLLAFSRGEVLWIIHYPPTSMFCFLWSCKTSFIKLGMFPFILIQIMRSRIESHVVFLFFMRSQRSRYFREHIIPLTSLQVT